MKARSTGIVIASLIFLVSCGGSSQSTDSQPKPTGTVNPQFEAFCTASKNLDAAMVGPHGENPAAITDPAEMKTAWASITKLSRALVVATPTELQADATTMMNSIIAMDDVFKANSYNLLEMAKMSDVRIELNDISTDVAVKEASSRFNTFLTKTCPK
ncbi:MAG: hypothetical protein F2916_02560 [Actinobacteria bacterium]|uniref:Unannotated protein n=1 Tax=freshwater metagenome TaxID=449393 RepID=A0A6J6LTE8_9ZZZZ|nr:hypothetical protein [Actinomycetota bacterium]MSZ59846.1 hypothetical protein [Actinomycetota bacterium]MSZ80176.1 hypothetical protein [Actinomycetota bacterium]